jgi:hypothetical protein
MNNKRSRRAPVLSGALETLEGRVVLSTTAAGSLATGAAQVSAMSSHKAAATTTTLAVSPGTLGQPVKFSVTVRGPASAGSPTGTVNLVDHGQVLGTLTLSPTTSNGSKFAISTATVTMESQAGGGAYFFGKHAVSAAFVPSGSFAKSAATTTFTVAQPAFATLAGGVKVATIAPGTGAAIQSGQTANVLYTGYLAKSGKIFDDSLSHGGTTLGYTLGSGQVIAGFDAGTVGMQVGETRIVEIPPAQGYGATANGSIPANSTLIFVLTLESIS